jgi:hypothetical protein
LIRRLRRFINCKLAHADHRALIAQLKGRCMLTMSAWLQERIETLGARGGNLICATLSGCADLLATKTSHG